MDLVMPLFAILDMDYSKYDGLFPRLTYGDTSVVLVDLPTLELLVMIEDHHKAALCITSALVPSTNSATQGTPDTQAGNCQNDHRESTFPPSAFTGLSSRASFRIRRVAPTVTRVMLSIGKLAVQY